MFALSRPIVVLFFCLVILQASESDDSSVQCVPNVGSVYPDFHVESSTAPCLMTTDSFTSRTGACDSPADCSLATTTQALPPIYISKTVSHHPTNLATCCSTLPVYSSCRQQHTYTHDQCQVPSQPARQQTCCQAAYQQPYVQPVCQQPISQPGHQTSHCGRPTCLQSNYQHNYPQPVYHQSNCPQPPSCCYCAPCSYPFPPMNTAAPSYCVQSVVVGGRSSQDKTKTNSSTNGSSGRDNSNTQSGGGNTIIDPIKPIGGGGGVIDPVSGGGGSIPDGTDGSAPEGGSSSRNETESDGASKYERYLDKLLDLLKDKSSSPECVGPSPMVVVPHPCSETKVQVRKCRKGKSRCRFELEDPPCDDDDDDDDDEDDEDQRPQRPPTIIVRRSSAKRRGHCNVQRPNCCNRVQGSLYPGSWNCRGHPRS